MIWSPGVRNIAALLGILLSGIFFLLPLVVILMSSLSQQWNGVIPQGFTVKHYLTALSGTAWHTLVNSLVIGLCASLFALLCGSVAALALRQYSNRWQRRLSFLFYLPSAIPSVSVGLGLLVAFSQGPLQMNGTFFIVPVAHFILVSAFTFSHLSAGLASLPKETEQVAASLGASPGYRLRHITLPLLKPWMISSLALSLALSMGELGATMMIYPPGWTTLPVAIFSLTDRGNIADSAALTIILVGVTLAIMVKLERLARLPGRA